MVGTRRRTKLFNNGEPDVVFMYYNPKRRELMPMEGIKRVSVS